MYSKKYQFYKESNQPDMTYVSPRDLYSPELGFGFVIERNRDQYKELQISELNSGFEPYYWLKGEELSVLAPSDYGVGIKEGTGLPLIFKTNVPNQGNYHITVTITAGNQEIHDLLIFTGRRRLMERKASLLPGETFVAKTTINICDIIPRGSTERHTDTTLDIVILADYPVLSEIEIEETACPTLYIAGDSTVTDQSCTYPYLPGSSYCGWGQMLSYYLNSTIAVSNHSHSGLTTESFRFEGHYDIILEQIKAGDYLFLQFAHNDQKLPHLAALGGYADNLRTYISEIRSKSAWPIIVTPIARNTWKGDGSYNDLLVEYSNACKLVGKELDIPVLDLHAFSMDFVKQEGVESAARYFFPKDYTHSNDFGGFLMAGYIARSCQKISNFCKFIKRTGEYEVKDSFDTSKIIPAWLPPISITVPNPPPEFKSVVTNTLPVNFTDLDDIPQKADIIALTRAGIISNVEDKFCPFELITRVEALDWVVKAVRFVPTNVYNDKYPDVIGHEWYAGLVETVIQNGVVHEALTADGYFHPLSTVTAEHLLSFCVVSYKCRKAVHKTLPPINNSEVSPWAINDISTARLLGLIDDNLLPQKNITRADATLYIKKLLDIL